MASQSELERGEWDRGFRTARRRTIITAVLMWAVVIFAIAKGLPATICVAVGVAQNIGAFGSLWLISRRRPI